MSYIAWKLSGLPAHRIIGSGTYLDSSRFRSMIGQRLGMQATSVHGWIIGEVSLIDFYVCFDVALSMATRLFLFGAVSM